MCVHHEIVDDLPQALPLVYIDIVGSRVTDRSATYTVDRRVEDI